MACYLSEHHKFTMGADGNFREYGRGPDGYGRKIATRHYVKLEAGDRRKRRVYAICFSNCASHYVTIGGQDYYLRDYDFGG